MSSIKVTKQEFKNLTSKYISVFVELSLRHPLGEEVLFRWERMYRRKELAGTITRIGTPNKKGIWFSDANGNRSYLELADDKYNKREVYRIENSNIYYVKYISESQNGKEVKYMYYFININ